MDLSYSLLNEYRGVMDDLTRTPIPFDFDTGRFGMGALPVCLGDMLDLMVDSYDSRYLFGIDRLIEGIHMRQVVRVNSNMKRLFLSMICTIVFGCRDGFSVEYRP